MNSAIDQLYKYYFEKYHVHNLGKQIYARVDSSWFAQVVERFIIDNNIIRLMNEGDR